MLKEDKSLNEQLKIWNWLHFGKPRLIILFLMVSNILLKSLNILFVTL